MVSRNAKIEISIGLFLCLIVVLVVRLLFGTVYKDSDGAYFALILCISICGIIYCIIVWLFVHELSRGRWKIVTGVAFLGWFISIVALTLIFDPDDFECLSVICLTIDITSISVFIFLIFLECGDTKFLISVAFPLIGLLILFLKGSPSDPVIVSASFAGIVVYFSILFQFVKRISATRWKFVTVSVFIIVLLSIVSLYSYLSFAQWSVLFYMIEGADAFMILAYLLCLCSKKVENWYRASQELEIAQLEEDHLIEDVGLPNKFTLQEIVVATYNFSALIGEGGSAYIYKGMIKDGTTVVVKRLKGHDNRDREFVTEIKSIACRQHVNLVHLLGYCIAPNGDCYLIYPFYVNGSLDSWLFGGVEKRNQLTWQVRYRLATEVASAIKYLHNDCLDRILHCDIKPENVLLDGQFHALLSDFGISKLTGRYQSYVCADAVIRGTRFYMAPEVFIGDISIKSDIYSYGMLLMELVAGQRNKEPITIGENSERTKHFLKVARKKLIEGKLCEIVDMTIRREGIAEEELSVLVKIALWCIQDDPERRPTAGDILDMLQTRNVDLPPESPIQLLRFLDPSYSIDVADENRNFEPSANSISISHQAGF